MCIIIANKTGRKIKEQYLKNCWVNNDHGAGIMYAVNGKVNIAKFSKFAPFLEYYKAIEKLNVPNVVHFRIATSGRIDEKNIHPFKINENLYLAHNGILSVSVPKNSDINDTQIYINMFLKKIESKNWHLDKGILKLIGNDIGKNNKFTLLDNSGNIVIINEDAGHYENDVWFSNFSYSYGYAEPTKKSKKAKQENIVDMWDGDDMPVSFSKYWENDNYCDYCTQFSNNITFIREAGAHLCKECKKELNYI